MYVKYMELLVVKNASWSQDIHIFTPFQGLTHGPVS